MSPRSERARLTDMLKAARETREFVTGMSKNEFYEDNRTQHAVFHCLEIIGEAAPHISEETKNQIDLPWREIRDMRNLIAHEYFSTNLEIVWEVATRDIPVMIEKIAEATGE